MSWRGFLGCIVVRTEDDEILEIVRCLHFFMALKFVFELVAAVVLIILLKVGLRVRLKDSCPLRFETLVKVAFHVDKELLKR
jgi:hypothetical protein